MPLVCDAFGTVIIFPVTKHLGHLADTKLHIHYWHRYCCWKTWSQHKGNIVPSMNSQSISGCRMDRFTWKMASNPLPGNLLVCVWGMCVCEQKRTVHYNGISGSWISQVMMMLSSCVLRRCNKPICLPLRSAGRMFQIKQIPRSANIKLINGHATFQRALKTSF